MKITIDHQMMMLFKIILMAQLHLQICECRLVIFILNIAQFYISLYNCTFHSYIIKSRLVISSYCSTE
jgi:hypothetical protein